MEQSQLVELIRTLSPAEQERVLQFASIPYFNQGKMRAFVPELLNICLSHPWGDPTASLDKKNVYARLFVGLPYIEGKLDKVMVEALKIVRTALLVDNYLHPDQEFSLGLDYAEIVRLRGLEHRFQQLLTRLQKMQLESPWRNTDHYHRQFLLEYAIHNHESLFNLKKGELNILNVLEALDIYALLNRIELLNRLLQQQKITKIEVPESQQHLVADVLVPPRYLDISPELQANYAIFQLLRKDHPEPEDIRMLFDLLQKHEDALSSGSLHQFYTYLRNVCILVLIEDVENIQVEQTLHELYKDNLKRGFFHFEGKLTPSRYWAISSSAIRVRDFDWAIEVIEKYKHDLIGENETQDIYRLNLANYLFAIGRYSECLEHIPPTSPFVDYLLAGKRLELKGYYELRSDLFLFKLEAFKVYLSRTSPKLLSPMQKQIHVDFVNLLLQISLSTPGDTKRADRIIERVKAKKQAAEWRWLLEKANEIKRSQSTPTHLPPSPGS